MRTLKKTLATIFLLALLFVNISISIHDAPLGIGNVLTTLAFGDGGGTGGDGDLEEGGGRRCYDRYQMDCGPGEHVCETFKFCDDDGSCVTRTGGNPSDPFTC